MHCFCGGTGRRRQGLEAVGHATAQRGGPGALHTAMLCNACVPGCWRCLSPCAALRRRGSRPTPATRTGSLALPGAQPLQLTWRLSPMTRPASCGTPAASSPCTRWRATLIRCVSSCCSHQMGGVAVPACCAVPRLPPAMSCCCIQVFCVSWTADGEVITGGADCTTRKFQMHLHS